MITSFREVASLRFYEMANRRLVWDKVKYLEKSQWYCEEELKALQLKKLKLLLTHAYKHVPFYRRSFSRLGFDPSNLDSLEQIPEIPVLKKRDLQLSFSSLMAHDINHTGGFYNSTGGTTGGPTRYFVGKQSAEYRTARDVRYRKWYGFCIGDRKALLWGAERDLSRKGSIQRAFKKAVFNTLELNAWTMTESSMKQFIQAINRFKPRMLEAYSRALLLLVDFAVQNDLEIEFDGPIVISAEMISSEERRRIEQAFGRPVYDRYGSREFGSVAQECETHDGMHVSSESFIVESIKSSEGPPRLLITNLDNFSMPFIRYDNGDCASLTTGRCGCGRYLQKIRGFTGRYSDFIHTPEGSYVNGTMIGMQIRKQSKIIEFQATQDSIDHLTIHVVSTETLDETDKQTLVRSLAPFIGPSITVDVVHMDAIKKPASGKAVSVISLVDRQESKH